MNRYIAMFLGAVGLIVLTIVLIVHALATPAGPTSATTQTPGKPDLTSYANTSTTMQLVTDSPVTSGGRHHDVIINVGANQATLTVTEGYEGKIIKTQSYPMTSASYSVFLRALIYNGFTTGNDDSSLKDERGHCALGSRTIYQIVDGNGSNVQRYWHTSCGDGTFGGNMSTVRQLFLSQVPEYGQLTSNINL